MTDEERFFAWLDGELSPEEVKQFEARVESDPELARMANKHRKLVARLRTAFHDGLGDAASGEPSESRPN